MICTVRDIRGFWVIVTRLQTSHSSWQVLTIKVYHSYCRPFDTKYNVKFVKTKHKLNITRVITHVTIQICEYTYMYLTFMYEFSKKYHPWVLVFQTCEYPKRPHRGGLKV